jgi:cyclopropane fatty-acyl-phospholipid synthase-like methyltransferase
MPELSTDLHTWMLKRAKEAGQIERHGIYGSVWGDPQKDDTEHNRRVRAVRDRFLLPYVHPDVTCVEIGPGGGRWTRYLLTCLELYCVEYYKELLEELSSNFKAPGLHLILNNGNDFPGIADGIVDFLFSYGVFVHLELQTIDAYVFNMRRLVKHRANLVIHYSDMSKEMARQTKGFSDNDAPRMREVISKNGFRIVEEDNDTLPHSNVIRFVPA